MIVVRLLGPLDVTRDGQPPPRDVLWAKNAALLIYLGVAPGRGRTGRQRSRDHIAGMLWGDRPQNRARGSLREALRTLKRSLGDHVIETQGELVRIPDAAVEWDIDRFDGLHNQGEWRAASQLVRGEFADGFQLPGEPRFDDWLAAERLAWRTRAVEALTGAARASYREGGYAVAIDAAERALALEPGSDAAIEILLSALAITGHRAMALERFGQFREQLQEYGATVTVTTEALVERVRGMRHWRPPDADRRGAAGTAPTRPPLVGRESQLRTASEAWSDVREGRGLRACVVRGPSGCGKTRLAEELANRLTMDGAQVVTYRSVETDSQDPESGLIAVLRSLAGAAGASTVDAAALSSFVARSPEWAARFPLVTPEPAEVALDQPLARLLRTLAEEQAVAIFLDDAHFLDRQSLAGLGAMARDLADSRVFMWLAADQGASAPALDQIAARIGRDVPGATIAVNPFAPRDVTELVHWGMPAYDAGQRDRLVRRIVHDSAGFPLLAVELLLAVAAGMELGDRTAPWPQPQQTLDQTRPAELPDSVVAAVRVRFRLLSEDAQQTLRAAAALPDTRTAPRLAAGAGLSVESAVAALDELEWHRWLVADATGYAFVAPLIGELVDRDLLTRGQRRRILDAVRAHDEAVVS